jgi:isopenicillin N synthase-like dioxygenase
MPPNHLLAEFFSACLAFHQSALVNGSRVLRYLFAAVALALSSSYFDLAHRQALTTLRPLLPRIASMP